tara:strand:+ start:2154 stop:2867 length:714 start_codon:yes stop_codon:yes gene_type:complete
MTKDKNKLKAEFDSYADEYHSLHKTNIAITGESPEYFSEYKIEDLLAFVMRKNISHTKITDFGSGIGNSIPFFRKYFSSSTLNCLDVSSKSIEISKKRFPGNEKYVLIDDKIPLPTSSQDVIFSACVFHHIPHEQHHRWLSELIRITKPGGLLAIYEHNPLNPLTVRAVNTCPLDVNAHLIRGGELKKRASNAGWVSGIVDYKLFFPSFLSSMRIFENYLEWLPLGAQYRFLAKKSS